MGNKQWSPHIMRWFDCEQCCLKSGSSVFDVQLVRRHPFITRLTWCWNHFTRRYPLQSPSHILVGADPHSPDYKVIGIWYNIFIWQVKGLELPSLWNIRRPWPVSDLNITKHTNRKTSRKSGSFHKHHHQTNNFMQLTSHRSPPPLINHHFHK